MKTLGILMVVAAAFLAGCNAVKGAAKDVSNVAQHAQDWVEGKRR